MHSIYVHIPFCNRKCPYCDFASYKMEPDWQKYLELLLEEINLTDRRLTDPLDTVYFGGGTPSLLPVEFYFNILNKLTHETSYADNAEITIEANPGTMDKKWLAEASNAGINRLSIGVQSLHDTELQTLGRNHDSLISRQAIQEAQENGFKNISLDLIFGIPGQTIDSWRQTLSMAVDNKPDHISLYPLTISKDCSWDYEKNGHLPDEDLVADMYDAAFDILEGAGLWQYEISNFARPGYESRHNLNYWYGGNYVGLGVSAHSKIENTRYWNTMNLRDYEQSLKENLSPIKDSEQLGAELMLAEKLILNLRLNRGIDLDEFKAGIDSYSLVDYDTKFKDLADMGLININNDNISLTKRARFIANEVFVRLLPDQIESGKLL